MATVIDELMIKLGLYGSGAKYVFADFTELTAFLLAD
jgi:hypothetical protein